MKSKLKETIDWLKSQGVNYADCRYVRREKESIHLLDFHQVFSNEEGGRKSEYVKEDGSHISEAGYNALTQYIRDLIRF